MKKSAHTIDHKKKAAFEEAELQVPAPLLQSRRSNVMAPTNIEQIQKPVIFQGLSTLQIDLGSPCALVCRSRYDIEQQWIKDDHPIIGTTSTDGNLFTKTDYSNDGNTHILNIKNFGQENSGNYELILKNKLGQISSHGCLEMKGVPPTFILEPKPIAVVKGKAAEFNCRVAGSPKPEVSLHSFSLAKVY